MRGNSDPLISIILPTYNRAHVLKKSIDSVLQQTYCDFELIVVDDGSKDATLEVIREITDPRIRCIRLDKQRGASTARNIGIRNSRAEFIAFQDSDDLWHPKKLEIQSKFLMQSASDIGVVYSRFKWRRGSRSGVTPSKLQVFLDIPSLLHSRISGDIRTSILRGNFITTPAAMLRKECIENVGDFDEKLGRFQDWDLWIRIASKYRFIYINKVLLAVNASDDQISENKQALWRAFTRMSNKFAHDDPGRNEFLAHYFFALGDDCVCNRKLSNGRKYLLAAARLSPWNLTYRFASCASLLGSTFYSRIQQITWQTYQ